MPEDVIENTLDYFSEQPTGDIKVQAKLDHHTTMLGGLVRVGRVVAATADDPKDPGGVPRVLVQIGGGSEGSYVRNWMPWTTTRAGYDGEWWAPELDEQVLVIAPSGNLTQGIIVGTLFRNTLTFDSASNAITPRDPLPGAVETERQVHKRIYKDGTSIIYDRNNHHLSVALKREPKANASIRATITADESIVLTAGSTKITINQDGAVEISAAGNEITLTGDVKVKGTMDVS